MGTAVLGKRGGETKIILDNGRDCQKSFLNLTFVKNALGESFEQSSAKENEEIFKERQRMAELEKQGKEVDEIFERLKQNEKFMKKMYN